MTARPSLHDMQVHLNMAADAAERIRVIGEMPDELRALGAMIEAINEMVNQRLQRP